LRICIKQGHRYTEGFEFELNATLSLYCKVNFKSIQNE